MKKKRPINLDLSTIRFPITAVVSILHRVSGTFLFLLIPLLLWLFSQSLSSETSFSGLQQTLTDHTSLRLVLWLIVVGFFYHLFAGLRHILMDMHIGEELKKGRTTAKLTLLFTIVIALFAGVWLW
jgi:succinate dehydrogenase / fumarate reductase cytochrome b subunit